MMMPDTLTERLCLQGDRIMTKLSFSVYVVDLVLLLAENGR